MDKAIATRAPRIGRSAPRRPLLVMYAGLALTAMATLIPLVDLAIVIRKDNS